MAQGRLGAQPEHRRSILAEAARAELLTKLAKVYSRTLVHFSRFKGEGKVLDAWSDDSSLEPKLLRWRIAMGMVSNTASRAWIPTFRGVQS